MKTESEATLQTTSAPGQSTTPTTTASTITSAATPAATGTTSTNAPATTTTPTPTYAATSWTSAQIPIDPALQQQSQHATTTAYQHYQSYASHYPQAAYSAHYQPYAPPITAQQSQVGQSSVLGRQASSTTTTAAGAAATGANNVDTADIATLNDALGSAGVDLRAEEETLQRSHDQSHSFRLYEDRSRKQAATPSFDTRFLSQTIRTITSSHKITRLPDDSINYLALALRIRLQDLLTSMIVAAHHRTSTQFDRPASLYTDGQPMWSIVVRSDVAKQLAAIERAEREEETRIRRERKERADLAAAHAAALAAQANAASGSGGLHGGMGGGFGDEDGEGGAKKKRKKEGPGVTARNMSEDVRKKMSNAVATQAAGLGGRYAWMNATNLNASITPRPKAPAASGAAGGASMSAATTSTTTTTTAAAVAGMTTTTAAGTTTTGAVVAAGSTTTTTMTTGGSMTTPSATLTSSWATPYIPTKKAALPQPAVEEDKRKTVTMRDAMFVIEKERGHGGGRGAARGWV
ncbi:hypothetical protein AX17_003099 [Amanita inopinata Kibby_2008]|nr:hypothetical protein AX17_003099 [Amanita inopinata Kibby_2008]